MRVRFTRAWGCTFVDDAQFEAGDVADLQPEAVKRLLEYEAVELLEDFPPEPKPIAAPVVKARKGAK